MFLILKLQPWRRNLLLAEIFQHQSEISGSVILLHAAGVHLKRRTVDQKTSHIVEQHEIKKKKSHISKAQAGGVHTACRIIIRWREQKCHLDNTEMSRINRYCSQVLFAVQLVDVPMFLPENTGRLFEFFPAKKKKN